MTTLTADPARDHEVAPTPRSPRSGPVEHQLHSQWSCRLQRSCEAKWPELRTLFAERDQHVRMELKRIAGELAESVDHRCLFVFPSGLIPLPDQLTEFSGVVEESLRSHFPTKPLLSPRRNPHVLVGLEIVHTTSELAEHNRRHNELGGHWLTAEEWVAVMRFRKEVRHLDERVGAVKGVLLQQENGGLIACTWRRTNDGALTQPHWFAPKSSMPTQGWMIPWCHERVLLNW